MKEKNTTKENTNKPFVCCAFSALLCLFSYNYEISVLSFYKMKKKEKKIKNVEYFLIITIFRQFDVLKRYKKKKPRIMKI